MINKRYINNGQAIIKLNNFQLEARDSVVGQITQGVYSFEDTQCGICSGVQFETLSEKDRYGLYCPVKICRDCGLVQTTPRMTKESYDRFYDTEYRKLYVGADHPAAKFFDGQVNQGKKIAHFLKQNDIDSFEGKLVVEVGCGAGGILKHFRDLGCDTKGCDLGQEYLDYGRSKFDLDLSFGPLIDLCLDKKPDIVIYSHVFEHILDIENELKVLSSIMDDNSLLYIEVPGIYNISSTYRGDFLRYLQNAHTYHFTLTTLKNILAKNGFAVQAGTEYIQTLSLKSDSRSENITNDYHATWRHLRKLESDLKFFRFSLFNIKRVLMLNIKRLTRLVASRIN